MSLRRITAVVMLVCVCAAAAGQSNGHKRDGKRIGLALAGGGALGFAHLGVILELEAAGVPVHYVSGTSMGSIVGALYATGYSGPQMLEIARETAWNRVFMDRRPRRFMSYEQRRSDKTYLFELGLDQDDDVLGVGVSTGQNAVELLDRLMRYYAVSGSFDRLPRPLRIVATDLMTGEEVLFADGDLKSAVRASMAVPGVFTPLRYRGRLLIDGGWVNVLPVDAVREMGADYVIAVNLNVLADEEEELDSAAAVLTQSSQILRRPRLEANLQQADLVISPEISDYNKASFEQALELVEAGRRAARAVLPQLTAVAEQAAQGPVETMGGASPASPGADRSVHIRRISFSAAEPASQQQAELLTRLLGETSISEIQSQVTRLYNRGGYEYVSYHLHEQQGEHELVFQLVPQEASTATVRSGYSFRADPFGSVGPKFMLMSSVTLRELSGEGSQWSTDLFVSDTTSIRSKYRQPLVPTLAAVGSLFVFSEPMQYYCDRKIESYYLRRRYGGSLGLRTQLFDSMEFTAAATAERIDVELREGQDLGLQTDSAELGVSLRGVVDTFDRYPFPRRGVESITAYQYRYLPASGKCYNTASFEQQYYLPLPAGLTLGLAYGLNSDLDSGAPKYRRWFLGGFGSFPGLHQQELAGRHRASAGTELRVPLFSLPIGVGDKVYATFRGNIGNVWDEKIVELLRQQPDFLAGGSIGLSADTLFGEVHLHFALASGDSFTEDPLRYAACIVFGSGSFNPFQPSLH
ncbi:MAG: patatin-like phospholipase family protein [bacterium]